MRRDCSGDGKIRREFGTVTERVRERRRGFRAPPFVARNHFFAEWWDAPGRGPLPAMLAGDGGCAPSAATSQQRFHRGTVVTSLAAKGRTQGRGRSFWRLSFCLPTVSVPLFQGTPLAVGSCRSS